MRPQKRLPVNRVAPFVASLSVIVTVAAAGAPGSAPVALLSVIVNSCRLRTSSTTEWDGFGCLSAGSKNPRSCVITP